MTLERNLHIGGAFPPEKMPAKSNDLESFLVGDKDDLKYMMSGRCGIMMALKDILLTDKKRVAYLPAYTCETVSGCFVRLGYQLRYYDVNRDMQPLYDENQLANISVFLLCGYYGFATFDNAFANLCRK